MTLLRQQVQLAPRSIKKKKKGKEGKLIEKDSGRDEKCWNLESFIERDTF